MKTLAILMIGSCVASGTGLPMAGAAEDEVLSAVYSTAYNGYVRATEPDGSFTPETYTFGEGEHASGPMRDASSDNYPFPKLARLLAPYLARQNYVPSQSSAGTDLLIVVHWGATTPYDSESYRETLTGLRAAMNPLQNFGGPVIQTARNSGRPSVGSSNAYRQQRDSQVDGYLTMLSMQNELRDKADAHNAALLGYLPEMNRFGDMWRSAGFGTYFGDLTADLEEDRYYVILAAYDFQRAWKQKQLKLLWVTRVSIRAHGNRFDEDLDAMIRSAARYFGQNSPGLMRQRVPEGKVEVGEPKVIGVVPDAGK